MLGRKLASLYSYLEIDMPVLTSRTRANRRSYISAPRGLVHRLGTVVKKTPRAWFKHGVSFEIEACNFNHSSL